MKSSIDIRESLYKYIDLKLDDNSIWGREFDLELIIKLREAISYIRERDSVIGDMEIQLRISRERGNEYMRQAIRNNEKYEEEKTKRRELEKE